MSLQAERCESEQGSRNGRLAAIKAYPLFFIPIRVFPAVLSIFSKAEPSRISCARIATIKAESMRRFISQHLVIVIDADNLAVSAHYMCGWSIAYGALAVAQLAERIIPIAQSSRGRASEKGGN